MNALRSLYRCAVGAGLILLASCGLDNGGVEPPPAATRISMTDGNNQAAAPGTAVATPPSVTVTDANDDPVSGVAVTFAVALGGGSISGPNQTTNSSGIATVGSWTLGPAPGTNTLTATAPGLSGSPVTFTAVAGGVTVTGVSPSSGPLAGGTSVMITGTNFAEVTSVTIGGVELGNRTVVSSTEITGTTPAGASLGPKDVVVTSTTYGSTICTGCFSYTAVDPSAFTSLSAGGGYTCALSAAGVAYCWGYNGFGRLGDGTGQDQTSPVSVAGGLRFAALSAGGLHACGVTTGGAVYCWGLNRYGQLGDGSLTDRLSPVPVAGGLSFVGLSAGGTYTCGVTTSGPVYCWGENPYGVLGDGTTLQRSTPVLMQTDVSLTTVSAGSLFACGLSAVGVAYCWGSNAYGQLGDATDFDRMTPAPVAGDLSFIALSTGQGGWNPACGITSAGAAYCWGPNFNGALGDGTTTPRLSPVAVTGGLSFVTVDVGAGHTCGLTADGTAYCWGTNRYAELGDGTTIDRLSPAPVSGSLAFTAISAGLHHTCALTDSGEAYCWGAVSPGEGAPLTRIPTRIDR
jgi:alpha-tubulin suppressor-like RCC1 family protein